MNKRNTAVGVILALAALMVLGLPIVLALLGGGDEGTTTTAAGAGGAVTGVPADYSADISRAGSICSAISGPTIAAQLQQESGWNPNATSPVGASGIAQFMPSTWASSGMDGDDDGAADINDPHDAIWSQGHYMCNLASQIQSLIDAGSVKGDVVSLSLAAYNAGLGAVMTYGGIPPYSETQNYVSTITANAQKYTETTTTDGGASGDGGTILAAARSKIGIPYVWGAASDDTGYDCSGLVMAAYAAIGISLPHQSGEQCAMGTKVSQEDAQPGDIVCWSGHVALWEGNGRIVEAPNIGMTVREANLYTMAGGPYFVHIDR